MPQEWHYTLNGATAGPLSVEELRQMVASGRLKPADLVWKQGMAGWAAINTIPILSPQAARPAAVASAPAASLAPAAAMAAAPAPAAATAGAVRPGIDWSAKAKETAAKAKTTWQGWSKQVKIGVVVGAAAALCLFVLLPMLLIIIFIAATVLGGHSGSTVVSGSRQNGADSRHSGSRHTGDAASSDYSWDDQGDETDHSTNPDHSTKPHTDSSNDDPIGTSRASMENYRRIVSGMSEGEVQGILGTGKITYNRAGITNDASALVHCREWKGLISGTIWVEFTQGQVSDKELYGELK